MRLIKTRIVFLICLLFASNLISQELKRSQWKSHYKEGVRYLKQGSTSKALETLEKAYNIAYKHYYHSDRYGKSLFQFYKVSTINEKFNIIDSLGLNQKVLEYSNSLRGIKRRTFSKYVEVLADSLIEKDRFISALPLYKERQSVLVDNKSSSDISYAKVLFGLGRSYKGTLKNNVKAKVHLEDALIILKSIPNSDVLSKEEVLMELVPVYISLSDEKKAKKAVTELLDFVQIQNGENSQDYSSTLTTIANIYRSKGLLDEAYIYQKQGLSLFDMLKEEDKDYYEYALSQYILALIEKGRSNYRESIKLMEQSYKTLLELDDEKHNGVRAIVLGNIGLNYDRIGDYQNALDYCEKALSIENIQLAIKSIRLMDKGYFLHSLGQYERSNEVYEKALDSMILSHGKNHVKYAKLLNNVGKLYFEEGRYNEALIKFNNALEIIEVPDGQKWHDDYSYFLNDYAKTLFELDEVEKAISLMKKNLEYFDKKVKVKNEAYYNRKFNLAKAYNLTKAYDEALPLIEEATRNVKTILGENHVDYGLFLDQLSDTYLGLGDNEKAITALTKSNSVFINQIDKIFQFSSENEKKAFIKMVTLNFNKLQSIAITNNIKNDNLNVLNLNNQLMLKGLLLNNSKDVLLKLKELNDEGINNKITFYKSIKVKRAKVLTQAFNKRTLDIDSLSNIINTKEAELVRIYNTNFKDGAKLIHDWEEVKRKLKPTEYAIEFSHFNIIENHKSANNIRYVAYIISADSDFPIMVNLFEENELEQISKRKKPNQLYSDSQLYNLIWKPLIKYIPKNSTIYYSPSGLLNQIAFAAIKKDNQSLIDLYNLNQISSTYKLTEPIQTVSVESSLLVGGINYEYDLHNEVNASEKRISSIENFSLKQLRGNKSRGESWTKLEGTVLEIQSIKSILNSKSAVTTLSDNNATESYFKALSGDSPSIIHIATHGYFYEKLNRVGEYTGLSVEDQYRLSEDPLLRSGLIFAGANYAWKNGYNPPNEVDDGILTAIEISNLDLSNTDLVVLSACETGFGKYLWLSIGLQLGCSSV